MNFDTKPTEAKMQKSIAAYSENLATIRAGRANASVLSKVTVDYYGVATPINQVAEVKASDARTLVIQPWDASTLTEERRREIIKQIAKHGEEAKVAVRNIRREANDKCKEMKKSGEMNEDEIKQSEKRIQDLTDKYIKEIDAITEDKNKEIMSI